MATIHLFKPPTPPPKAAQRSRSGVTADIIMFPGVRYERWLDAASKPKRRRKTKTRIKRDRLTIVV